MIIRQAALSQSLYLSATRELIPEEEQDPFESLFADEYQKAKHLGKLEGEKLGYEKAALELASLVSLLQRLSERLLEQKSRLLQQMKPEVVEFSLAVCERILRKELQDPQTLIHTINQLLQQALDAFPQEKIKIFLSPEDLDTLLKNLNKVFYDKTEMPNLSFHADKLMGNGDCRIETKSSILNADIQHVLDDLKMKIQGCC